MPPLKIHKKNASKKTPDPTLSPDDPCWCGSGYPYERCHQLYDKIYSVRKKDALDPYIHACKPK